MEEDIERGHTRDRPRETDGGREGDGERDRESDREGGRDSDEGSGGTEGQKQGSDIIWSSHGFHPRHLNPEQGLVYLRI